jgi:hypothetical protein
MKEKDAVANLQIALGKLEEVQKFSTAALSSCAYARYAQAVLQVRHAESVLRHIQHAQLYPPPAK